MARFTSKVSRARPSTISLRTTVPVAVAKMLELKEGDTLCWDVETTEDGLKVIVSRKRDFSS